MLRIGSSKGGRGFTLVEIMVSTCVLALGVVFIYRSFLTSLSAYEYCMHYVAVAPWANDQIARAQCNVSLADSLGDLPAQGEFLLDNKPYSWKLTTSVVSKTALAKLYAIHLELSWKEAARPQELHRDVYALYQKK